MPPTPAPTPGPPRFHSVRNTAPTLAPNTVTARLANVPVAEWEWLRTLLESRGWKVY